MARQKRESDGQTHHPPKTVEQQSEDSFPASDPPSFMGSGAIGAPVERESSAPAGTSKRVTDAQKAAKSKREERS